MVPIFISDYALACALGMDRAMVAEAMFAPRPKPLHDMATLVDGRNVPVARLPQPLDSPAGETHCNRIVAHCLQALRPGIERAFAQFGPSRLGVVIGVSTSGIGEGAEALHYRMQSGAWPKGFSLASQQLGDTARFAANYIGAQGPCYSVSTACTSGARAIAAAARLILADLCDVVVCGGVDTLCSLTLNGFAALDSLSPRLCNPMSVNRDGLNLGEGGALFLLSRSAGPFRLVGWGGSVDGHHISAPDPTGQGAEAAMIRALRMAGATAKEIDFVHLHGTATRLNDQMEAQVIEKLLGLDIPCASTKPMTGHTLGAAGAIQAALCLLALDLQQLPPHLWDGVRDPDIPNIRLAKPGERTEVRRALSASYAFGGNNAALVLANA